MKRIAQEFGATGVAEDVYHEYMGHYKRQRVLQQVEKIYETCLKVFNLAGQSRTSTQEAAIALAEKRINEIGNLNRIR